MPWDDTTLYLAQFDEAGLLQEPRLVMCKKQAWEGVMEDERERASSFGRETWGGLAL
jgi:uncharacterized protein HemY